MKRLCALLLAGLMLIGCVSCGKKQEEPVPEPEESKIQSICQLAVMECYYHNVAKTNDKDVEKHWWSGSKDRRFWVEYTGIVTFGIDASKVTMEINGNEVTVTMPKAKVLKYKVDSTSLDENSYIVDKASVKITSDDVTKALTQAQEKLKNEAESDETLLTMAQNRAKELVESYVRNLTATSGADDTTYTIKWVYVDNDEV